MDKKPLAETMTVTAWFDVVVIPQEVRDCDGALRRTGFSDPDWEHGLGPPDLPLESLGQWPRMIPTFAVRGNVHIREATLEDSELLAHLPFRVATLARTL